MKEGLAGVGIGLVMSPMSTAAMNSVNRTKAGAASGVLSMSRMVGGTFGVAVMGALVTAIGRSKIDSGLPSLPASARADLAKALGSGSTIPDASPHVVAVAHGAFVSALGTGLTIGAIVAAASAVVAGLMIERNRVAAQPAVPEPQASAEAGTVRELAA